MIPLKDDLPTRRFAAVTAGIIALNALAFLWQLGNSQGFEWAVWAYGAVPYEILTGRDLAPQGLLAPPLTVLSSMFLHGGLAHIGFNMLFLWIFGNNVEDAMGRVRFVLFYLLAGLAAAATQIVLSGPERVPMVGASGAIAGVLGAYLVLYPRARVLTLVPIFIFVQFYWLPAYVFLVLWFAVQLLSSASGGGVAWYAHIGGFVAGLLMVKLFARAQWASRPAVSVRRYRWG